MAGQPALHVFVSWYCDDDWELGKPALYHSPRSLGLNVYTIEGVEYCTLLDFCMPLDHHWLKEKMEDTDDDEKLEKLEMHKEFADYFQAQIEMYCELLFGRSYSAIYALEEMLPFNLLLSVVSYRKIPYEMRSSFVKLIERLWVDRFPHEPNCGKQNLPELIWVMTELEDLAINDALALPHFVQQVAAKKNQSSFYTISSADKFQMLNKFIVDFFEHIDRQVIFPTACIHILNIFFRLVQ